ncbi:MAG TPA: hypothetical protein VH497_11385 [Vicinamibacterales bacterium]|jgi:hypothetical protein
MMQAVNVQPILLLLGAGFLVVNARAILEYVRYLQRRRTALLTWPAPKPPQYALSLAIGVALGVLVFFKVVFLHRQAFGETMMFIYYAYLLPLGRRIGRGFYEDGIWADSTFIPYGDVGGVSWREGENQVTLLITSRLRNLARRLNVPGDKYGAARRLLRDKIGDREIHLEGTGLNLGGHDERNTV